MGITVSDLVDVMEEVAPSSLAESWDNVGLQVGSFNRPVNKVIVALDPTPAVVSSACSQETDLLITHHPLIFHPVKSVNLDLYPGNIIGEAIKNGLAIYAAHTNLDSCIGGVNDIMSIRLKLRNVKVLRPVQTDSFPNADVGLGRVGDLEEPIGLKRFAEKVKQELNLESIRVVGKPDTVIERVCICCGSGSSLLKDFLACGADTYVSGDLHYHDGRTAEIAGKTLIDIGHFYSEHLIVAALATILEQASLKKGWDLQVIPYPNERDPFTTI
ncbi:MAG: Nif3-like dinuclear metal center hexameric protein [Pseudomonadota bacterium]